MLPRFAHRPLVPNARGVRDQITSVILVAVVAVILLFALAPDMLQQVIDFMMTSVGVGLLVVLVLVALLFMRKEDRP